ncbi:MAG: 2-amino-3,7-dideoxy-D-threo-hept-6-ulosonate synthase [Candidatus Methanofastidiosa archaeon]|nr:2-amino-3,7-dideoxy-D-threo-hept-6-ulosonate synthase [Candidatus Methanofastidiosa archaeon]MDD4280799.1 2-amino-3,7-dideoxy-D-threo-hept-6-ulosonate synthase [Candidatus Methanofastidiosa archaeon]
MNGKDVRLNRITQRGKAVIIPMDHGTTVGPIAGLRDMNAIVSEVDRGGATAVVLHKGIMRHLAVPTACGMIMHLSASTMVAADPDRKVLVGTVSEAVRLGADAVSVHVNVGGTQGEPEMLAALGTVAGQCEELQMPLLAMMYPRGPKIPSALHAESVALAARVGAELGADLVKTVYTGDIETFEAVVDSCPVPIVIAGGPKCTSDMELLQMVEDAMAAGSAGVSLGRNAFQHERPRDMVRALRAIIIEGATADEAMELVGCPLEATHCVI